MYVFFFFKQKTAYEMRISDWSSDVCSSDLRRFTDPAWKEPPFNLIVQAFLLNQQWWHAATTGIGGVSRHHEDMVEPAARQIPDLFAPTHFLATHPLLQRKIVQTGRRCVVPGFTPPMDGGHRPPRGAPPVGAAAFPLRHRLVATSIECG